MLKKFSALALAGLLALPAAASAGSSDVAAQIDRLSKELEALKAQMATMKEDRPARTTPTAPTDNRELKTLKAEMATMKEAQEEAFENLDEKSEAWDLASRFKFYGDFRTRADYYGGDLVAKPVNMSSWQSQAMFDAVSTPNVAITEPGGTLDYVDMLSPNATTSRNAKLAHFMGYLQDPNADYSDDSMKNDTMFTNRFRLNMRVKATENVEFKGRLAMYKVWGTNSLAPGVSTFNYPSFDGTSSREPSDNTLRVDRAYVNWNNIASQPIWLSVGRRPTTDGPPAHVRQDNDQRTATPMGYMDWPFDGFTLGYAYANLFGIQDAPGRVRFCYGRGFENGLQYDDIQSDLNDTDFAGISWDIYKKDNRFLYFQSYMIFNAFNFPKFDNEDMNDFYTFFLGERQDIGDVLHTSAVYQDKWEKLNYFIAGGWSRTMPDSDTGMFNDFLAGTINDGDENGYNIWVGARYDLDDMGLKFGLEYNHGSRYWIGMTPGHDDMYSTKLGTRGDVYEAYMIWDLPTGEKISKYAKTFVRLGYQHYEYNYSGGTDWNIKPYDGSDARQYGAMVPTLDDAHQVYLTFEAYF